MTLKRKVLFVGGPRAGARTELSITDLRVAVPICNGPVDVNDVYVRAPFYIVEYVSTGRYLCPANGDSIELFVIAGGHFDPYEQLAIDYYAACEARRDAQT